MRRSLLLMFLILAQLSYGFLYQSFAQGLKEKMYIKPAVENLRDSPAGDRIGQVVQGTQITVLETKGKWVKVRLTAWIWKESLTDSRTKIKGYMMRALHILVKTRPEAENILTQLKAGANFEELAKKYSIGPNAQKGGDLGYFGKGDLMPEFDETIRALKPGELSGIVETKLGYHIFKRLE